MTKKMAMRHEMKEIQLPNEAQMILRSIMSLN